MKRRNVFVFILMLFCCSYAWAQTEPNVTFYREALPIFNPAATGQGDYIAIFASHRQQWVGFDDAPKTFFVAADMPYELFGNKVGLGVNVVSDKAGPLWKQTMAGASIAPKFKFLGGVFSLGGQAGMASLTFDGTKVKSGEGEDGGGTLDPAIPTTSITASSLDMNVGFFYKNRELYIGGSAAHLFEPELDLSEIARPYFPKAYNFIVGYNIKFKQSLYQIQPSVLIRNSNLQWQTDVSTRFVYASKFMLGLNYRNKESVGVLLGASFGSFHAGYSYEYPTTAIRKESTGSHELMIRYTFELNKKKTGNYKYKNIRVL